MNKIIIFLGLILALSIVVYADTNTPSSNDSNSCIGGVIDYFNKGNLTIKQGFATITGEDYCFDSSIAIPDGTKFIDLLKISIENKLNIQKQSQGTYLFETTCASEIVNGTETYLQATIYKCPNGCSNGACINTSSNNSSGGIWQKFINWLKGLFG